MSVGRPWDDRCYLGGVTDGVAVAEVPGIEVDFDEVDCLVAVAERPEDAQRFSAAGGTGVEEGLDVAEVLGVTAVSPLKSV